MEDKGGPLRQAALRGTLKALPLDALRLYQSPTVSAEEIGRESARACRQFDVRWQRAFRARAISGPWDVRVISPILAPPGPRGNKSLEVVFQLRRQGEGRSAPSLPFLGWYPVHRQDILIGIRGKEG
jgi:hypothetical protein